MRHIIAALIVTTLAAPAFAQEAGGALADRLLRLERDVNFLQRQVYTDPNARSSSGAASGGGGNAQLEVRMSQLEEQMRQLRGQFERVQYDVAQVQAGQKKIAEDMEYRLQALEQAQAAAAAAPAVAADAETPMAAVEEEMPASYKPEPKPKKSPTGKDFPNSNAHYNHAFKLLNGKEYSAAATSFDQFVKTYPDDPLTSNAYYWLGESYYARGDFTRAAEGFRKGFETNPEGQKAPDNLLKLAMSLGKIKRNAEACVVLGQVVNKYGESNPRTGERATVERQRLQCK